MSYLEKGSKTTNSLINEDSPYLLQHAYNPVEWMPWGDDAFDKAIKEDKPIFLSIGYSSCHWCHVMESEVFENEELARKLNNQFVCIKVDREERPDIDKHYQLIHQIITRRSGGWPTSIFLTKHKNPYFAGTYIPPARKYNMMGFGELIDMLAKKHRDGFAEVDGIGANINSIAKTSEKRNSSELEYGIVEKIKSFVIKKFDHKDGGILGEPKFPHISLLSLMLNSQDSYLIERALFTLTQMSRGGIYDIIDGGFCRYSVDSFWLVPHFEKMLYDNGAMISLYTQAYKISNESHYLQVARDCADFMNDKMSDDELFYSASDADTDGEEGLYFIYTYEEAFVALFSNGFEETEAKRVLKILGFGRFGNFEGKNIAVNESFDESDEIKQAIKILKQLRQNRKYPFVDKKIICSWNAMMISGLFELGSVEPKYLNNANKALKALTDRLYIDDTLFHCTISNKKAKIDGFLEDYAYLAKAYLDGFRYTNDKKLQQFALKLAIQTKERFFKNGVWLFSDLEFVTYADISDTSYASAIAPICEVLIEFADISTINQTLSMYAEDINSHCAYHAAIAQVVLQLSE